MNSSYYRNINFDDIKHFQINEDYFCDFFKISKEFYLNNKKKFEYLKNEDPESCINELRLQKNTFYMYQKKKNISKQIALLKIESLKLFFIMYFIFNQKYIYFKGLNPDKYYDVSYTFFTLLKKYKKITCLKEFITNIETKWISFW